MDCFVNLRYTAKLFMGVIETLVGSKGNDVQPEM